MKLATHITLLLQLALAVIWNFLYLTVDSSNWGILLFFILVFGAHIPLFLFAAWSFWRHPALRRTAAWAMALPFISLGLSLSVRALIGDALSATAVVLIVAAATFAALVVCLARPKQVMAFLPYGIFASRGLNLLIVALQIVGWLLPIIVFPYLAFENAGRSIPAMDSSGMGLAYILIAAAMYFAGIGIFAVFAGTIGWLGWRGNASGQHRALHVTQLVIAAPTVVIGVGALLLLYNVN